MKLYRSKALPDVWIGEDPHGGLVQWPAREGGWADRTPYSGARRGLEELPPATARGTGWPGGGRGRPPRAGAPTRKLTIAVTDGEREELVEAAGERPLADWARSELLTAARKKK